MKERTENSPEKSLDLSAENKAVAVYVADFGKIVGHPPKSGVVIPGKKPDDLKRGLSGGAFSNFIFRWRTVIGIAAILVIGGLNFVFQLSFQTEVSRNRPVAEAPPVVRQPVPPAVSENRPIEEIRMTEELRTKEFEPKKNDRVPPPRPRAASVKAERSETAPARAPGRKKAAVESTAARLRRAEKILTGI